VIDASRECIDQQPDTNLTVVASTIASSQIANRKRAKLMQVVMKRDSISQIYQL